MVKTIEFLARNVIYNIGFSFKSKSLVNATCVFPCGKVEDLKIPENTFASIVSCKDFCVMEFLDVVVVKFQVGNYEYLVDVNNVFA